MSGKQILSIVLAVIVGIVAIRIALLIISVVMSAIGWVIVIAVGAGVVYALYRGFNHMLTSGKRLT